MSVEELPAERAGRAMAIEAILAPIDGGATPAGADLRYDPVYDRIQELRRQDDPNVPQGIWETTLKRADWDLVRREIEAVLATRSKDLQLAAWLVEAQVQIDGLAGLARGLKALTGLCERYWPYLHPAIDDGDLEARLAPIFWLEDKLPTRIALTPLTHQGDSQKTDYSWADWQGAQKLEPLAASKPADYEKAVARGAATVARVTHALKATQDAFYQRMARQLQACLAGIDQLRGVLNDQCGNDAPTLSRLTQILTEVLQFVERTLAERGRVLPGAEAPAPARKPAEPSPKEARRPPPAPGTPGRDRPITSRDEAYQLLTMAADYLVRTEPHSPVPYLVMRAVAWGRMPLSDLLAELLEEDGNTGRIFRLLNLPPKD